MVWNIDIKKTADNDDIEYDWENIPNMVELAKGDFTFTPSKVTVNDKAIFLFDETSKKALGLYLVNDKYPDSKANGMRFIEAIAQMTNTVEIDEDLINTTVEEGMTLTVSSKTTKNDRAYKHFVITTTTPIEVEA